MKRYAIIEIPARVLANEYLAYGAWYPILTGPVELMQVAFNQAGVQEVYQVFPGDFYYDTSVCAWKQAKYKENFISVHFVIPAPKPEPGPYQKTFCPECGFGVAVDEEGLCVSCGMTAVGRAIDNLQETEPEKEKPCPNCQGIPLGTVASFIKKKDPCGWHAACSVCGKSYLEWTYASEKWTAEWQVVDPGGIGCGGTGGPS